MITLATTSSGSGSQSRNAGVSLTQDNVNMPAPAMLGVSRSAYLAVLASLFGVFNAARVLAYLPTIWAVMLSGDSSQHSLWTWITFLGGNATMAAWLWEQNGQRCNRAIFVSAGNALMCLAISGVIAWTRL